MILKQNFPHVELEEQEVPGAIIAPLKDISSNTSVSLKRWLATGGLTMTGRQLIWSKDKFFSLVQAIEALSSIACAWNSLRAMECGMDSVF